MKKVRMIVSAALVFAVVGSALAFKGHVKKQTPNLFIMSGGSCIPGCHTNDQGDGNCPTTAYSTRTSATQCSNVVSPAFSEGE